MAIVIGMLTGEIAVGWGDDAAQEPLSRGPQSLPQGNTGIAARYPGDVGLAKSDQVVFMETFSAPTIEETFERWESIQDRDILSYSADTPKGSSDEQSLLVTHIGGEGDGAYLYRRFGEGYDRLHYRFYVKFDPDCAPIHHFFHVGGYNPPTAWPQGGAGERPRGGERFTTGVEPFGNDWRWDYYSYWMEMRGSPPRGQTWGNSFIHNPELAVKKGEWECLELMMQLNDSGQSNGEMALWIDGKLVSHLGEGFPRGQWTFDKFLPGREGEGIRWDDERNGRVSFSTPSGGQPFDGFRFRTTDDEQLNFLWLLCYITRAPAGHTSRIWFDNIVVATDYIGPIAPATVAK
jgi:hypothetical protein